MAPNNTGSIVDVFEYGATPTVLDHIVYDAFGGIASQTDSTYQPLFTYNGEYTDPATGLQKHGDRWYDPRSQRWLTQDPIFPLSGSNPYEYCGNSPTNFLDPSGEAENLFTDANPNNHFGPPSQNEFLQNIQAWNHFSQEYFTTHPNDPIAQAARLSRELSRQEEDSIPAGGEENEWGAASKGGFYGFLSWGRAATHLVADPLGINLSDKDEALDRAMHNAGIGPGTKTYTATTLCSKVGTTALFAALLSGKEPADGPWKMEFPDELPPGDGALPDPPSDPSWSDWMRDDPTPPKPYDGDFNLTPTREPYSGSSQLGPYSDAPTGSWWDAPTGDWSGGSEPHIIP
jgi:RHS repeat-associated protein